MTPIRALGAGVYTSLALKEPERTRQIFSSFLLFFIPFFKLVYFFSFSSLSVFASSPVLILRLPLFSFTYFSFSSLASSLLLLFLLRLLLFLTSPSLVPTSPHSPSPSLLLLIPFSSLFSFQCCNGEKNYEEWVRIGYLGKVLSMLYREEGL